MRAIDLRRRERLLAGAALLLGERWKYPASRMFGVNASLVNRWAAGANPVPKWVIEHLDAEMQEQRKRIDEFLGRSE